MIKGVNHTIIEIPNPTNRYFERALLFVRPNLDTVSTDKLRRQADFFVESLGNPPVRSLPSKEVRRNRRLKRMILSGFWWLTGIGCGLFLAWIF